jgi:hypothetical protein
MLPDKGKRKIFPVHAEGGARMGEVELHSLLNSALVGAAKLPAESHTSSQSLITLTSF